MSEKAMASPRCHACGARLRRLAGRGGGGAFWSCTHYPRCSVVHGAGDDGEVLERYPWEGEHVAARLTGAIRCLLADMAGMPIAPKLAEAITYEAEECEDLLAVAALRHRACQEGRRRAGG